MTTDAPRVQYRYPLFLLTVIYVCNFIDRQIVTILAEPIKAEFALADWQLGMMTGLSFAILYTLAGFPLARLAERGDRARIIGIAVIAWSAFTAIAGFAQSFVQFVLARIGVGLGEAGCTPPAHSLISDLVPRERRGSALALYSMGAPLGQLVGMALGGVAAALWGWRVALFIAGAPGIVLAILALTTLPEPRRRAVRSGDAVEDRPPPFWATIRSLLGRRSYRLIILGAAASSFLFYGLNAFYGSFFIRNHAAQLGAIAMGFGLQPIGLLGLALGASSGVTGIAGAVAGGRLSDAWARRDPAAYVLLPALCSAAAMPLLLGAILVGDVWLSIALIALAAGLNSAWAGAAFAAALGLVHPRSRATASALMLFTINLIGLGLGPLAVGLVSDLLAGGMAFGPAEGLRWAMACTTAAALVAAALFWSARHLLRAEGIA